MIPLKRKPIHAGDTVEYIRKTCTDGELRYGTCTVIAEDVKIKDGRRWVDAYVFANNTKGLGRTWFVMEEREFYETFKLENEDIDDED